MKNTKAILAGALIAPALALTGGIAYASTTTPSHPAPARATVTATAQHPIGQARLGWCDWRSHGHHAQPAQQHRAGRHHSYRHNGYQHRGSYGNRASQRGYSGGQSNQAYSYQGNGYQGNGGSHWANGGGCCRHGW